VSDDSCSDEPMEDTNHYRPTGDNVAESFEISDSELADIDLDFVMENATA